MTRYFPELVAALQAELPERCVIDGEIVIPPARPRLDFEALQQRIHPAESRVQTAGRADPGSASSPSTCWRWATTTCTRRPFAERRAALEEALAEAGRSVHLTPATTDRGEAQRWFAEFEGAGLDGVVAKPLDSHLPAGQAGDVQDQARAHGRLRAWPASAGTRPRPRPAAVGSLLLGLYNDEGELQHVGVIGAFTAERRRELVDELRALR